MTRKILGSVKKCAPTRDRKKQKTAMGRDNWTICRSNVLGAGLQGTAYKACRQRNKCDEECPYVAKVSTDIAQAEAEAELLRKINHKHVVKVHDAYECNHSFHLITDNIPVDFNGQVNKEMQRDSAIDAQRAEVLARRRFAEAVQQVADEHKCVSTDINTGNIRFNNDGEAVLFDFGSGIVTGPGSAFDLAVRQTVHQARVPTKPVESTGKKKSLKIVPNVQSRIYTTLELLASRDEFVNYVCREFRLSKVVDADEEEDIADYASELDTCMRRLKDLSKGSYDYAVVQVVGVQTPEEYQFYAKCGFVLCDGMGIPKDGVYKNVVMECPVTKYLSKQ